MLLAGSMIKDMIPLQISAWNARHAIVKKEFLLETTRLK